MIIDKSRVPGLKRSGFLVIEGVNGAGKTSVKKELLKFLTANNIEFVETFEPGGTPLGKSLRELLLGDKRDLKSGLAELFLFAADRAEHIERVIKPALAQAKLVVCDRYYYSTTAFQGYGRENDLAMVESINRMAVGEMLPDLVLLLDLDAETGLKRNRKIRTAGDTFSADALEREALDFHNRIRNGFLKIAESSAEPFYKIDASKSLEEVCREALEVAGLYCGL